MWFLYFGRKIGMSKAEILVTDLGEMMDMMSCFAVLEGGAEIDNTMDFFDIINLK